MTRDNAKVGLLFVISYFLGMNHILNFNNILGPGLIITAFVIPFIGFVFLYILGGNK